MKIIVIYMVKCRTNEAFDCPSILKQSMYSAIIKLYPNNIKQQTKDFSHIIEAFIYIALESNQKSQ